MIRNTPPSLVISELFDHTLSLTCNQCENFIPD